LHYSLLGHTHFLCKQAQRFFSRMSSNLLQSHAIFSLLVPVLCVLATASNATLSSKNLLHISKLFPVWNTLLRKLSSEFTARLKELYLTTYHIRAHDATVDNAPRPNVLFPVKARERAEVCPRWSSVQLNNEPAHRVYVSNL